jgi:hypothetical protein
MAFRAARDHDQRADVVLSHRLERVIDGLGGTDGIYIMTLLLQNV